MGRAITEPVFGWALLLLIGTLPKLSKNIRESILLDMCEGLAKSAFALHRKPLLPNWWGTLIAGLRTLLDQREDAVHMDAIAEISLVVLGMEFKEAHAVVLFARPD